jgi:hypothetical protein
LKALTQKVDNVLSKNEKKAKLESQLDELKLEQAEIQKRLKKL